MPQSRTAEGRQIGSNFQTRKPNKASPRLPKAAPAASSAAAWRPRIEREIPARSFFSFSCFSTRVALAGNIAGNARNNPPKAGPKRLASRPAITVMAPPTRKRTAYSYHLVLRNAEKSKDTLTGIHLSTSSQAPTEKSSQTSSMEVVAAVAGSLNFIIK